MSDKILRQVIREIIKESYDFYYDGQPLRNVKHLFDKAYKNFPDRKDDLDVIQEVWQKHDDFWWFVRDNEPNDKGLIRASKELLAATKCLLEIDLSQGIPEKDPEPVPEEPNPDDDKWGILNKERKHRHAREDWHVKNINPHVFIRKLISNSEATFTKNDSWDMKFSHILQNLHRAAERSLADVMGDQLMFSSDPKVLDQ